MNGVTDAAEAGPRSQVLLLTAGSVIGVVMLGMALVVGLGGLNDPSPPKMPKYPGMPTLPSGMPTNLPSNFPTSMPSGLPTGIPTNLPTNFPTNFPTKFPTKFPGIPHALPDHGAELGPARRAGRARGPGRCPVIAAPPATTWVPKVVLVERIRDDARARARALLVARLMIVVYLLELLLNLTRPHVMPGEPALSIFMKLPKASARMLKASLNDNSLYDGYNRMLATPRVIFWTVLAGIVIAALVQVFGMITRAEGRRAAALTWVTLAAVIGPFSLLTFVTLVSYPLPALACVPFTAVALALLHSCQRFARLPLGTLLFAFGWGALIVYGAGRVYTGLGITTVYGYMFKGLLNADGTIADQHLLHDSNALWSTRGSSTGTRTCWPFTGAWRMCWWWRRVSCWRCCSCGTGSPTP